MELFDRKFDGGLGVPAYDVTADGQTFVMTRSEHEAPTENPGSDGVEWTIRHGN